MSETAVAVTETRFSVVDVGRAMTRGSEFLLSLLLGVPAAAIGLLLLSLGPLGWFLAAFLGVAVVGAAAVFGGSDPDVGTLGADRTNCPRCGSRTAADGACEYCDEPL